MKNVEKIKNEMRFHRFLKEKIKLSINQKHEILLADMVAQLQETEERMLKEVPPHLLEELKLVLLENKKKDLIQSFILALCAILGIITSLMYTITICA